MLTQVQNSTNIQNQKDVICKLVREIANPLKDKVAKKREDSETSVKEYQSLAAKTEKDLRKFIEDNKEILQSKNAETIICYQSKKENYRNGSEFTESIFPLFESGYINRDYLNKMFGTLQH